MITFSQSYDLPLMTIVGWDVISLPSHFSLFKAIAADSNCQELISLSESWLVGFEFLGSISLQSFVLLWPLLFLPSTAPLYSTRISL